MMVLGGMAVEEAWRAEVRPPMAVRERSVEGLREYGWVGEGRRIESSNRRDIATRCFLSCGSDLYLLRGMTFWSTDSELAIGGLGIGLRSQVWPMNHYVKKNTAIHCLVDTR